MSSIVDESQMPPEYFDQLQERVKKEFVVRRDNENGDTEQIFNKDEFLTSLTQDWSSRYQATPTMPRPTYE